jgi:hypothetical protein
MKWYSRFYSHIRAHTVDSREHLIDYPAGFLGLTGDKNRTR